MDWFLHDKDLRHESVYRLGKESKLKKLSTTITKNRRNKIKMGQSKSRIFIHVNFYEPVFCFLIFSAWKVLKTKESVILLGKLNQHVNLSQGIFSLNVLQYYDGPLFRLAILKF